MTTATAATASPTVQVARPMSLPPAADRFVVVEASAGTGKTFFLEHRVVDLVLSGAELGQILLVTFTDKAVAELRLRIRDLLDRLARASESTGDTESVWHLDAAAKQRLRDAVNAFDHAPIFTIHGFCYRILVEDAFAAHRLFEQTQVADEVAFDAAFVALLRERFANVSPDRDLLSAYLTRGDTVDKLRTLLLACARKDAPSRASYTPDAAAELGESLKLGFGTEEARTALMDRMALKGNDKRYVPPWVEAIGQAIADWDGAPAGVFALCDAIRKSGKTEPGPKLLARLIKLPALAPVADVLKRALVMTSLDEAVAAVMLPQVIARIGADKAETGMFDYNDMLQLVRDALHGPRGAELAIRLRARTPWVMIDEFQDTDPVQWNIFRTVWMDPAASGLTIVGDPKQAIYGFRGADVATYMDARDELLRNGATRVDLDVNRRSTAAMVEAVNKILLADGISPMLDQTIRYDHPVSASGDVEITGARRPITVFQLTSVGRPSREDARQALAAAIGVEIEALRAAAPVWTSRGTPASFSLGHCMVLTRTNSDSDGVAQALRARGLACALVEGDRLFETREAHELADVLAAVAAPRDRSARMRALRTRFFDVPWTDLMRVVDAPDHHPLIARLFDWAALASRRAYEALFRELVEASRFAERALVLGGGERAIINTWHLIELLLEEVARSRSDLHELVTQLRRWITDGSELPDDRDVQRAETDLDAVRILTVHKAKGLEAPYVFVYGAASPPRASNVHTLRDGAGRALVVGPQDDAIAKQLVAEADAENQRLAYVALTRAKVAMYLPRYPDEVVDAKSMYWAIQRCLAPLAARKDVLFELRDVAMGTPPAPPAPAGALARFEPPPPPVTAQLVALDPRRTGLAMLSYTRLGKELDAAAIGTSELPVAIDPAEFDAEPESPAESIVGPDELPPGIDSGLLLHDLLEHADLGLVRGKDLATWIAEPSVRDMIVEHARERGIALKFHAHAARLVHAALTEPLAIVGRDPLPPLVEATAFAREVEFAYPIPGPDQRGLVKGYIDALVAWDDELWVLDYKSDVLAGDPVHAAEDHARSHYTIQQRLYALAAERMKGSRRVAGMLFAFVRYGVVVALPFDDDKLVAWTYWLANLRTEVAG
ncbi:MAG: UvrD-helicase domain-containing protein [Deltaproteobacteria bacterium]